MTKSYALLARFAYVSNQSDPSLEVFFLMVLIKMLETRKACVPANALVWQFLETLFREGCYLFTS